MSSEAGESETVALPLEVLAPAAGDYSIGGEDESGLFAATGGDGLEERLLPASDAYSDGNKLLLEDGGGGDDGRRRRPVGSSSSLSAAPSSSLQSWGDLFLLNLGWAGLTALVLAWNVVLLPSQTRAAVGDEAAGRAMSIMVAIAAVLIVATTPYMGIISDAFGTRWGRRRPLMLLGVVLVVAFQTALGLTNGTKPPSKADRCAPTTTTSGGGGGNSSSGSNDNNMDPSGNLGAMMALFVLATLAYQLVGVPYNGLMADRTPDSQRGISSGLQGLMTIVG